MISQQSVPGKEPWLAVSLSSIFPGFGHSSPGCKLRDRHGLRQIYAGQTSRGLLLIFIALILFGLSKWLIFSPTGSVRLGTLLEIGEYLLYFFNLFDAYRCTRKSNSHEFERLRTSEKDPWKAVFLSRIVPGFGQVYATRNGQEQWGFVILFIILARGTEA